MSSRIKQHLSVAPGGLGTSYDPNAMCCLNAFFARLVPTFFESEPKGGVNAIRPFFPPQIVSLSYILTTSHAFSAAHAFSDFFFELARLFPYFLSF
jgi:hypothetical protein